MLNFYQSLALVVVSCLGFGAMLARRLFGDGSIGTYELVMMFLFMVAAIYLTVDAYKMEKEQPHVG